MSDFEAILAGKSPPKIPMMEAKVIPNAMIAGVILKSNPV
jgi:hypothetical protein